MKELNKETFTKKIETQEDVTFYFFFKKNHALLSEIWRKEENNYFCNFEKHNYTREHFLSCINFLLKNYKDIRIFED